MRALLVLCCCAVLAAGCGRIAQEELAPGTAPDVVAEATGVALPDAATDVQVERAQGSAFFLSYEGYLVRFTAPRAAVESWVADGVGCLDLDGEGDQLAEPLVAGEGDPDWWAPQEVEPPLASDRCTEDEGQNLAAVVPAEGDPVTVHLRAWRS